MLRSFVTSQPADNIDEESIHFIQKFEMKPLGLLFEIANQIQIRKMVE